MLISNWRYNNGTDATDAIDFQSLEQDLAEEQNFAQEMGNLAARQEHLARLDLADLTLRRYIEFYRPQEWGTIRRY
jgi:hypothetical protein